MVTKTKAGQKKVKVDKLRLNKETVKDLSKHEARAIKGGHAITPPKLPKAPSRGGACTDTPTECIC